MNRIIKHFIESNKPNTDQIYRLRQNLLNIQQKKEELKQRYDADKENLSKKESSIQERIHRLSGRD